MNLMNKIDVMQFSDYLELKYVEWQRDQGKRRTVSDFASYIGFSQAVVSMWLNGSRIPNEASVRLLANIFGLEVYDSLGIRRPDEDLHFLEKNWEDFDDDFKKNLREQAEKYAKKKKK